MDPVACEDEETERLRHQMAALIQERMDGSVTIHDFRLVKGPTHTNLIFDIVVPFALKLPDDTVRKEVAALAASLDPAYRTVIEIDRSYVR